MNHQELVKSGLLKEEKIGFEQINRLIKRARQNLKSANILIQNNDEEGGFKFAYEAMLLAGRALVFSFNLRPRTEGSHKIVVEFAEKILGGHYKDLIQKFNKMRKKRHYFKNGCLLFRDIKFAESLFRR